MDFWSRRPPGHLSWWTSTCSWPFWPFLGVPLELEQSLKRWMHGKKKCLENWVMIHWVVHGMPHPGLCWASNLFYGRSILTVGPVGLGIIRICPLLTFMSFSRICYLFLMTCHLFPLQTAGTSSKIRWQTPKCSNCIQLSNSHTKIPSIPNLLEYTGARPIFHPDFVAPGAVSLWRRKLWSEPQVHRGGPGPWLRAEPGWGDGTAKRVVPPTSSVCWTCNLHEY